MVSPLISGSGFDFTFIIQFNFKKHINYMDAGDKRGFTRAKESRKL